VPGFKPAGAVADDLFVSMTAIGQQQAPGFQPGQQQQQHPNSSARHFWPGGGGGGATGGYLSITFVYYRYKSLIIDFPGPAHGTEDETLFQQLLRDIESRLQVVQTHTAQNILSEAISIEIRVIFSKIGFLAAVMNQLGVTPSSNLAAAQAAVAAVQQQQQQQQQQRAGGVVGPSVIGPIGQQQQQQQQAAQQQQQPPPFVTQLESGVMFVREYSGNDPTGLQEKAEFLLREWVEMLRSPQAAKDPSKAFSVIVSQVHFDFFV